MRFEHTLPILILPIKSYNNMIKSYAEYAAKKSVLPFLPALIEEFSGLVTFSDACKIIAKDVERFEQEMETIINQKKAK